jgi:nicastrin
LFQPYSFPIISVNGSDAATLRANARANKARGYNSFPQYAVNFYFYMGPDNLDSLSCISQGSCLPIGGQSIWASVGPLDAAPVPLNQNGGSSSRSQFTIIPKEAHRRLSKKDDAKEFQNLNIKENINFVDGFVRAGRSLSSSFSFNQKSSSIEDSMAASRSTPDLSASATVQRPVVMLVASLDSTALIHELSIGAVSAISGVVTVLAAADALARSTPSSTSLPLQILFGLFQAEQWGRVGSRRWVSEVQSFTCDSNVSASDSPNGRPFCASPLRYDISFSYLPLSKINYVLAVDQVGTNGISTFFLHERDTSAARNNQTMAMYTALDALGAGVLPRQVVSGTSATLPPSPVDSFLEFTGLDGAVLSGYDRAFTNPYYNSQFDTFADSSAITDAATAAARGIYALATNSTPAVAATTAAAAVPVANATLVSELLYCFTVTPQCDLFARILGIDIASLPSLVPAAPLSTYSSVYIAPSLIGTTGYVLQPSPYEAFVRNFLASVTTTEIAASPSSCSQTSDCADAGQAYECIVGVCVIANAFYHDALSLSVVGVDKKNGKFLLSSTLSATTDPLWTEPYWSSTIGAKMYIIDSSISGYVTLGVGLAVAAASIGLSYLLIQYLDVHYKIA